MSLADYLLRTINERQIHVTCSKCRKTKWINPHRTLTEKEREDMRNGKRTVWIFNTSSGWYCPTCEP